MKLIIGLGNPGRDYEKTRHNLGFMVVTELSRQLNIPLSHTTMQAQWGRGRYENEPVILARPTTYMNLSGLAVAALSRYYKIPFEQILVVIDDMNLPVGAMRFRAQGSAGGHNGLKSIIEKTGSLDFHRLRIGINNPHQHMQVTDFVLGRFSPDEQKEMGPVLDRAVESLKCWLGQDIECAMREYN
ncbi:aminoacyl-tRNA hydrolase [bacterium]|nr:aminoacyl-tRNA hydrolase [bacterium]